MNAQDLKNSILQLAIHGKLVEQRPEEGTAQDLLQQIQEEKKKLIKEGKIKKDKPLPPISEDEIPFEIPGNWKWCRMGDILTFLNGRAYTKDELLEAGKYKVLRVGNLFTNNSWYYSNLELEDSKYCENGDLLYAWSASFGPSIWSGDKTIFHYHIWKILFNDSFLSRDYLYWFLLHDVSIIKKSTKGSTMIHVSMVNMMPRLIPIPPLEEQKRIVAKIEELMPHVEKYGEVHEKVEALNKKFPEDMQKSILQYAIMGKLVEQREEEGSGEELYHQIQEEKKRLLKEAKIKNDKPLPPISEDEVPFEIPGSWKWVRLGTLCDYGKCESIESKKIPHGSWVLDLEDIESYTAKLIRKKRIPEVKVASTKHVFKKDDILYSKLRPYLNKVIIADEDGVCTSEILPLNFGERIFPAFIQVYLMSPHFLNYANMCSYGVKMPRLGTTDGQMAVLPLPPLEEQKRIVAKVEDMLPHIDRLKVNL